MSKCVICGNEILTGDIHWNKGLCNNCYRDLPKGNIILNQNLENMFNAYSKILEEKDQRIAELEKRLENAIIPKFEKGQEVYYYHIARNKTYSGIVEDIQWFATRNGIYYRISQLQRDYFWIREDELFATKELAEQRLVELKKE